MAEATLLLRAQRCASCGRDLDRRSKGSAPHVDHDHRTGAVRGVTCSTCNSAAGLLGDDPVHAYWLALYLLGDHVTVYDEDGAPVSVGLPANEHERQVAAFVFHARTGVRVGLPPGLPPGSSEAPPGLAG